ncbi:hypothetical protein GM182_05700 [bacterium 3DAC]|nr:hypothetical protein [Dictyoglomota bacterium]UZN23359.1 hypothetical protein GM182_05700 [bacterium 3DAC]
MSIKVNKARVAFSPYIIRLGYIRRIHSKPLDVWSYKTHEPDYLLSLPSHMLHSEPLDVVTTRLEVPKLQAHIENMHVRPLRTKVRNKRMLKVHMRRYRNISLRVYKRHVSTLLKFAVHTIVGFYGVPIKRRGIPADKVSAHVKSAFRVLLMKKKIRSSVNLKYYFPNVAISPSGKLKYLGNGYLLVIPARGTRIMLNVYIVEDNKGKEYMLMEVIR